MGLQLTSISSKPLFELSFGVSSIYSPIPSKFIPFAHIMLSKSHLDEMNIQISRLEFLQTFVAISLAPCWLTMLFLFVLATFSWCESNPLAFLSIANFPGALYLF